jgi:hypothetical protein
MVKGREETMFPNMIVHFLYEEQRRKDEIRKIQLENEYHRALQNSSAANRRNSASLRSRFGLLAARLSAIVRSRSRQPLESGIIAGRDAEITGSPDPCTNPRLAC